MRRQQIGCSTQIYCPLRLAVPLDQGLRCTRLGMLEQGPCEVAGDLTVRRVYAELALTSQQFLKLSLQIPHLNSS